MINKKLDEKLDNVPHPGITRRQVIRAAGVSALGLAFSKPVIETIYPKPAFADYVVTGNAAPPDNSHHIVHDDGSGSSSHDGSHESSRQGGASQGNPATGLEPLGDNLVRVWEFSNDSKEWSYYSFGPGYGGSGGIKELVPGRVYFMEVRWDQRVVLNGIERSLSAGWNYIIW